MNRNRNLLIVGLGLFLAAALSCSGEVPLAIPTEGDPPPSGEAAPPGNSGDVPPVDTAGVPPVDSIGVPIKSTLLTCQLQEYLANSAVIGLAGGQITVGDHTLIIPAGAVLQDVTITAEQVEGTVNSVRFTPEGLRFLVPAELTLSYKNCVSVNRSKRVVYTDELLNILEPTLSQDFSSSSRVQALILHFSRYAVAY